MIDYEYLLIKLLRLEYGPVAHLGERFNGIEEGQDAGK